MFIRWVSQWPHICKILTTIEKVMIHFLLGTGVMVVRLRGPFVLLYLDCEDLNILKRFNGLSMD